MYVSDFHSKKKGMPGIAYRLNEGIVEGFTIERAVALRRGEPLTPLHHGDIVLQAIILRYVGEGAQHSPQVFVHIADLGGVFPQIIPEQPLDP